MNNILNLALAFLTFETMTPKKLQKLCYYAQAWHLALTGRRLINTEFQAWVHGPVERKLYFHYKDFGYNNIPQKTGIPEDFIDPESANLVNEIYRIYGELDGNELEALTHSETPWINARNSLRPWEISEAPILDSDMRDFYNSQIIE